MNDQSYEDYMRAVLGYQTDNRNTYEMNCFSNAINNTIPMQQQEGNKFESYYPKLYRIINPIVCEVCNCYQGSMNQNVLNEMVEKVLARIEMNQEWANELNVNIDKRNIQKEENVRSGMAKINQNRVMQNEQAKKNREVESRQIRNPLLRDIIQILILNRLLGGNFRPEPIRPRPPMRPIFEGRPRPPMGALRNYDDYLKF